MNPLSKILLTSIFFISSYSLFSQESKQDSVVSAIQDAKQFAIDDYNCGNENPEGNYNVQITLGERDYLYIFSDSDLKIITPEVIFYDSNFNGLKEEDPYDYCKIFWGDKWVKLKDPSQANQIFYEYVRDIKAMYAERTE